MAFNHSDTDRIAVYPNRPPKKNDGVSCKLEAVDSSMVSINIKNRSQEARYSNEKRASCEQNLYASRLRDLAHGIIP